jgi:hypothetical protein
MPRVFIAEVFIFDAVQSRVHFGAPNAMIAVDQHRIIVWIVHDFKKSVEVLRIGHLIRSVVEIVHARNFPNCFFSATSSEGNSGLLTRSAVPGKRKSTMDLM